MQTHDHGTSAKPHHIFVYGTLLPGHERWPFLQGWVVGQGVATTVAADLFDTGYGYPAAIFAPDERYGGGTTMGMRFRLGAARLDSALAALDEVEGAVVGLFHRIVIRTADEVDAWAYTLGDDLDLMPVPSGDWRKAVITPSPVSKLR